MTFGSSRRSLWIVAFAVLVLAASLVIALASTYVELPIALVAGACLFFAACIVVVGVSTYREAREDGAGVFRSMGRGLKESVLMLFTSP